MEQDRSKHKDLKIGDLVTHVLYGKEWVGMILGFKSDQSALTARSEKALVQIQPGTKYEKFFLSRVSPKDRINENLGYVTTSWLFLFEARDGSLRFTRN